MRRRRMAMGCLLRKPWERLDRQGFLEAVFAPPDSMSERAALSGLKNKEGREALERFFVDPAGARSSLARGRGRLFRVRFLPPMEVGGERTLLGFKRIVRSGALQSGPRGRRILV